MARANLAASKSGLSQASSRRDQAAATVKQAFGLIDE